MKSTRSIQAGIAVNAPTGIMSSDDIIGGGLPQGMSDRPDLLVQKK